MRFAPSALAALAALADLMAGPASAAAPAIPATAIAPDPTHASFTLPQDLKWTKEKLGQMQAPLFGDPGKPGPYGVLVKWLKGNMSHPHFHTTDRWAYVVKGSWWISTSDHYDPATTYPLPEGSFATDFANKVHWDGAKDEDVVILITGMGPMKTVSVLEK